MRTLTLLLVLLASSLHATDSVQSRFIGPVSLQVWEHWQPSWNVDLKLNQPPEFELERGFSSDLGAYLQLTFRKAVESGLQVRITGTAHARAGTYGTQQVALPVAEWAGQKGSDSVVFRGAAPQYLDESGKRIVTSIEFEVWRGSERLYQYKVVPMYVRGSHNHYWNNPTNAYMAHAGSGTMSIANGSTAESGWDRWDGRLVHPQLNFIDRNTMQSRALIGLHRHEGNQEMWLVEKGQVEVANGVALRASPNYSAKRSWEGYPELREVTQFDAKGGWLETRVLQAGEYSVIVPDAGNPDLVCFHGLLAMANSVTFTMGTKN